MRKIRLLWAIFLAVFWVGTANAETVKTYFQNELTQLTSTTLPSGWSTAAAAAALYSSNASITVTANSVRTTGSAQGGNRGYCLIVPASNTFGNASNIVVFETDWVVTSGTTGSKNALGIMVDASASSVATPVPIFGLYACGAGTSLYLVNYRTDSLAVSGAGSFNFASASGTASVVDGAGYNLVNKVYTTDAKTTGFVFAKAKTYHITATLDFTQKKITSLVISGNSNTAMLTNIPFFDQTASVTNVGKVSLFQTRGSNKANGGTTTFDMALQNMNVYKTSDLGNLSSNSPQCASSGVTISTTGTALSGETYYWQSSATGTSTASSASTYNASSTGSYYLRSYTTTGTLWSDASSPVAVTVNPISVGGTATATNTDLFAGYGTTITLAGNTGTIQWQESANNIDWANVTGGTGATTTTYTTPILTTAIYYYRALVKSGACSESASTTATVTVTDAPTSSAVVTVGAWTSGTGTFPAQAISTASGEQTFTVSGTALDGDIVLVPPAGFEISLTSGIDFVNSTSNITLTPSSGTIAETTIYVHFVPGSLLTTSGNITINSLNTIQQIKALSGHGVSAEPTVQASAASTSALLSRSMSLSWTAGDGAKHLVLYSANSDVETAHLPVDGTTYTVGSTTAAGYIVGYVGTGLSTTLTGLTPNTHYYYAVFDYNDGSTAGAENYLTGTPAAASATTVQTSATDGYFRSVATGSWSAISTWESSADNSSWHIADVEPIAASLALVTSPYTVTVNSAITANTISMGNGANLKMQTGAAFTKPISGTGTISLEAASNNFYTMAVTNASTVNVLLDNAGSTNSTWSDYWGGSFPSGAQVNVTTGLAAAGFGVVGGLLTNNKVDLGAGVRLMYWYNQSVSGGGTSIITVGEVSGAAGSTIEGGTVDSNIRHLAYEIGSLNTDATFAGIIKNYGAVTTAQLKIYKKGTGTWTLTGTSTFSPGLFNVDAGKVLLTGALTGAATPVTVAASATLGGTGTIAGATSVAGTLEGRLNFGTTLALAGTTKFTVTEFAANQYDSITVVGAVTNGGALIITVNAATPTIGTSVRLIKAASYTGSFSSVTLPAGYSYNAATGVLTYTGKSYWSGTGTWGTSANWGGTVPSTSANICVVSGALTIDQNLTLADVTVYPTARLILNSGYTLDATGNFALNSDATGTGTFVDANTTGGLTVSGTTTVQQHLTGALTTEAPSGRFWYISSPVTGATSATLNVAGRNKAWSYAEPTHAYTEIVDNTTSLAVGTGYAVRLGADTTITFTGALNTGEKTISLTRNDGNEKSGYNLVGNPYPSFIDYHAVTLPVSVMPSIWTRSCTAGGLMAFDTYNSLTLEGVSGSGKTVTQHIAPMQAFWVKVASGNTTGSITLTNAMRYAQDATLTTNLLKAPSVATQQVLRLQVSNGTNSDETVIAFNANASDAFDNYDSPKMSNNNVAIPEIYTLAGTEKVAINGMKNMATLALGFTTGEANTFSIVATEIKNFDADTKVILKDNLLNTEQDITDGTAYSFTSDVSTGISRFSIVFKTVSITTGIEATNLNVNIFKNTNGLITVNSNDVIGGEGTVTVCNALGQKLVNTATTGAKTVINKTFSSGVYLVTLNVAGAKTTKKVIIN